MRLTGDKGTSTARCVLQRAYIWFYFVVLHMRVAWKTVRGNDTVVINTPVASVKPRSHRPNWTGLATVDPVTPSVNRHAHRTASRDTDLLRTDCLQVGRILRELHLVQFECGFSEHDQNLQVARSVARSLCDSRDLRRCGIVQTGYAGHGTVGRAKKLLDERAGRWVVGSNWLQWRARCGSVWASAPRRTAPPLLLLLQLLAIATMRLATSAHPTPRTGEASKHTPACVPASAETDGFCASAWLGRYLAGRSSSPVSVLHLPLQPGSQHMNWPEVEQFWRKHVLSARTAIGNCVFRTPVQFSSVRVL